MAQHACVFPPNSSFPLSLALTVSLALGAGVSVVPPARADTTQAWCWSSLRVADAPVPHLQRCTFSQRQGNALVRLEGREYAFPAALDGTAYQRSADDRSLRFETPERWITVYWQDPKPYGGSPRCSMNQGLWRPCQVLPLQGVKDGFEVRFAGTYDAPTFRFRPSPGSPAPTNSRRMLDGQGNPWRLRGHHSFSLREEGGFRNRLDVAVD